MLTANSYQDHDTYQVGIALLGVVRQCVEAAVAADEVLPVPLVGAAESFLLEDGTSALVAHRSQELHQKAVHRLVTSVTPMMTMGLRRQDGERRG